MNGQPDRAFEHRNAEHLARRLRDGRIRAGDDEELSIVLGWLGAAEGSTDLRALQRLLGQAGDERDLLTLIFDALDDLLFFDGRLDGAAAGIRDPRDEVHVRRRFRLLQAAFHPDRYPWHAAWLTLRSQAINEAYSRYRKTGRIDPPPELLPLAEASERQAQARAAYRGIAPFGDAPPRRRLLARLGQPRTLLLALVPIAIVGLPLLSVYLESRSQQTANDPANAASFLPAVGQPLRPEPDGLIPQGTGLQAELEQLAQARQRLNEIPAVIAQERAARAAEPAPARPTEIPASAISAPAAAVTSPARDAQAPAVPAAAHTPETAPVSQRLADWFPAGPGAEPQSAASRPDFGTVDMGPLSHQPIRETLERYRQSVESGSLEGLLRSHVQGPRANWQQGQRWVEESYARLFELTDRRQVSIRVTDARRHPDGWVLEADYQLRAIHRQTRELEVLSRRVTWLIVPDPLVFRIAAVDY